MSTFTFLVIGTIVVFVVGVPLSRYVTDLIFRRRRPTIEEERQTKQLEERKRDARYFWR